MSVGNNENRTKINPARYFEAIICKSVNGRVSNNSIVPLFFSSANERIVIAGIRNINTHGATTNKPSILEYPFSSTFESPGKIHINKPTVNKKTVITIYPISELKKLFISFFNKAYIMYSQFYENKVILLSIYKKIYLSIAYCELADEIFVVLFIIY